MFCKTFIFLQSSKSRRSSSPPPVSSSLKRSVTTTASSNTYHKEQHAHDNYVHDCTDNMWNEIDDFFNPDEQTNPKYFELFSKWFKKWQNQDANTTTSAQASWIFLDDESKVDFVEYCLDQLEKTNTQLHTEIAHVFMYISLGAVQELSSNNQQQQQQNWMRVYNQLLFDCNVVPAIYLCFLTHTDELVFANLLYTMLVIVSKNATLRRLCDSEPQEQALMQDLFDAFSLASPDHTKNIIFYLLGLMNQNITTAPQTMKKWVLLLWRMTLLWLDKPNLKNHMQQKTADMIKFKHVDSEEFDYNRTEAQITVQKYADKQKALSPPTMSKAVNDFYVLLHSSCYLPIYVLTMLQLFLVSMGRDDEDLNNDIVCKAVSGCCFVVCKQLHAHGQRAQFAHFVQLFCEANGLILLLKFFNQDMEEYVTKPNSANIATTTTSTERVFNWRKLFVAMNWMHIFYRMVKFRPWNMLIVVDHKGEYILKKALRLEHREFRVFTLKLLKVLLPYATPDFVLKENMLVGNMIYFYLMPHLAERWLTQKPLHHSQIKELRDKERQEIEKMQTLLESAGLTEEDSAINKLLREYQKVYDNISIDATMSKHYDGIVQQLMHS